VEDKATLRDGKNTTQIEVPAEIWKPQALAGASEMR
jgi:hypothetical protein